MHSKEIFRNDINQTNDHNLSLFLNTSLNNVDIILHQMNKINYIILSLNFQLIDYITLCPLSEDIYNLVLQELSLNISIIAIINSMRENIEKAIHFVNHHRSGLIRKKLKNIFLVENTSLTSKKMTNTILRKKIIGYSY